MPKRQSYTKVDSDEIMGTGSWIRLIPPTVSEAREMREKIQLDKERVEQLEEDRMPTSEILEIVSAMELYNAQMMAKHVIEWNWVQDEAGEIPFPQPLNNPEVFLELNRIEQAWIGKQFLPDEEKKEKSKRRSRR